MILEMDDKVCALHYKVYRVAQNILAHMWSVRFMLVSKGESDVSCTFMLVSKGGSDVSCTFMLVSKGESDVSCTFRLVSKGGSDVSCTFKLVSKVAQMYPFITTHG